MPRQTRSRPSFPDGAADIARRFGVTIKTLRLYEAAGLIRPVRDAHGWRTYGQAECERLHLVLLLRKFGLSIAQIGALLGPGQPDLAGMLDLQAQALTDQRRRIDDALALIGRARAHLADHGTIDPAALAALTRAQPSRLRWSPALEGLAARCFTVDQQQRLAESDVGAAWEPIYRELDDIIDQPPDTPRARALGGRAAALIERMTGGDPALRGALTRFWWDGFADPAIAPSLPLDHRRWMFLGQAMRAHQADDGR